MNEVECKHPKEVILFDSYRGELTCNNCGLVMEERIPLNPFEPSDQQKVLVLNDKTMDAINHRSSDPRFVPLGSGFYVSNNVAKNFNSTWRKKRYRFMYYQQTTKESHATLHHKMEIASICDYFQMPRHIRTRALYLYQKYAKTTLKQYNGYYTVAIILLVACREYNLALTINEVCHVLRLRGKRIKNKRVFSGLNTLLSSFKLSQKAKAKRNRAEDFLPKFLNDLKQIKPNIDVPLMLKRGQDILKRIPLSERGSRNPVIFTIATIYALSQQLKTENDTNYRLSQNFLANQYQVADYSLRDHWRFIQTKLA